MTAPRRAAGALKRLCKAVSRPSGMRERGRRELLVVAGDPPRRLNRVEERRRRAEHQPVVVLVVLEVAGGAVRRADGAAELLRDRALDREGAERGPAAVVVDRPGVVEREDRRIDLHVAEQAAA